LVKAVPDMTPQAYVDVIARRFSNPFIVDTTRRVAFDGSSRHAGFIIPSIRDGLDSGSPVEGLALVSAVWARMCEGTREDGSIIEPNDPFWDSLHETAKAARTNPAAWLDQTQYYGDLAQQPRFADAFKTWLEMIWADGVDAALDAYCAD
jgi:mannitol 2-dehydrogenase